MTTTNDASGAETLLSLSTALAAATTALAEVLTTSDPLPWTCMGRLYLRSATNTWPKGYGLFDPRSGERLASALSTDLAQLEAAVSAAHSSCLDCDGHGVVRVAIDDAKDCENPVHVALAGAPRGALAAHDAALEVKLRREILEAEADEAAQVLYVNDAGLQNADASTPDEGSITVESWLRRRALLTPDEAAAAAADRATDELLDRPVRFVSGQPCSICGVRVTTGTHRCAAPPALDAHQPKL